MSAAAVRAAVVRLARTLAQRGYLAGTGGNIALRIDTETFAVTPSATDYYGMQAEDVPLLRIRDLARLAGTRTPSVESSLHARVFRDRPDCTWSIHTHQPVASACALLGAPLDVETSAARMLLGPRVALVGYAPSGTRWLAARLGRALRPTINAYLMRNHGILCCGTQLATALDTVAALEAICAAHVRARLLARAAQDARNRAPLTSLVATLDERRAAPMSRSPA